MKNKLKILSVLSSALLLAGCGGLVDNSGSTSSIVVPPSTSISEGSTSGNSTTPGPNVETVKMTTGESKEIPGAAVTVASGDEKIISIEQQTTKAIIYALSAGKVTLTNGTDTFEVVVSYDVLGLSQGGDYLAATDEQEIGGYRDGKNSPYQVGIKNTFKPDINLIYNTWKYDEKTESFYNEAEDVEITEAYKHLSNEELKYTFTFADESSKKDARDLVNINEDATISFKETAIGKSITLTVEASFTTKPIVQTYFINEGYNAYAHKDFKELFQDNKISCINLLHNINAVYDESQMYFNTVYNKKVPFNTQDAKNEVKFQGSMYFRYGGSNYGGELQKLVVNGNYMTIDAQNLPKRVGVSKENNQAGFFDANDEKLDGLSGTQADFIDGDVINPQEAIFRVHDFDETYKNEPNFIIKNLELAGDSKKGADDSDNSTLDSGGSTGVILGKGINGLLDNVYFRNLVYGAQANYYNTELKLKNSTITNTWGASVTTWQAKKLSIENSALKEAGAPTIWSIQSYGASSGNGSVVCEVNVDEKSEITNYLTTTSNWFNAYHLSIANYVGAIETMMNMINYTIYKPNTKQISFALLLQHPSDTSDEARLNLKISKQEADMNPSQFFGANASNTYGKDILMQLGKLGQPNFALILALGQEINKSVTITDYNKQLATQLGTYKLSGEEHLYIEVAVDFPKGAGSERLSAVLEVTPLSTSN